jgi:hypothetical protein
MTEHPCLTSPKKAEKQATFTVEEVAALEAKYEGQLLELVEEETEMFERLTDLLNQGLKRKEP